jgi:hypothetical protein
MKRENIEQIIRDLFKQNYKLYPENYPDQVGEAINTALLAAEGYWDNRDETEIERDKQAGVTLYDYENWVKAELKELKNQTA